VPLPVAGPRIAHRRISNQQRPERHAGRSMFPLTMSDTIGNPQGVPPMKHPEKPCDCLATATSLTLRWCCLACGKTAIKKVSTLATVCDGVTIRRVEQPRTADSGDPEALVGLA